MTPRRVVALTVLGVAAGLVRLMFTIVVVMPLAVVGSMVVTLVISAFTGQLTVTAASLVPVALALVSIDPLAAGFCGLVILRGL